MNSEMKHWTLEEVLEEVALLPPDGEQECASFNRIARDGYDKIRELTEKGYSFGLICDLLVARGFLAENRTARRLARAFAREQYRRLKEAHHMDP